MVFSLTRRLGSEAFRLSQIQDGKGIQCRTAFIHWVLRKEKQGKVSRRFSVKPNTGELAIWL
jgi:hypothetical protein